MRVTTSFAPSSSLPESAREDFIAPEAYSQIYRADALHHNPGDKTQGFIACFVSFVVIDGFEVVDVTEDKGNRSFEALLSLQLFGEPLFKEIPPRVKVGEMIADNLVLETPGCISACIKGGNERK